MAVPPATETADTSPVTPPKAPLQQDTVESTWICVNISKCRVPFLGVFLQGYAKHDLTMRQRVVGIGLLTKAEMLKNGVSAVLSRPSSGFRPIKPDYKDAVKALNSLQTNAALLKQYKLTGYRSQVDQAKNVVDTKKYILRSGISLEQLDQLSVIHVAGTKGKGSTCAFCESILRHYGFKTGFFSSPHLVDVRERICINGRPLSKQDFTTYFFQVYNKLNNNKEDEHDMPPYFKFLTVMAFYTFLAEKVDVAIIEVGIGGEHDCTNVLRQVQAVGITSLGLDHTNLLGSTISEIAWQKAGIMKPGCMAFTSSGQPDSAMKVLVARAAEKGCALKVAPPIMNYGWGPFILELGVKCQVQQVNASLALQLAHHWLEQHGLIKDIPKIQNENSSTFDISLQMSRGLKHCHWPGRTQIIQKGRATYFLDGAHTDESMEVCVEWFHQASTNELHRRSKKDSKRVLVFNATGFRDSTKLLQLLFSCNFHCVIFCPNIVNTTVDVSSDQANLTVTEEQANERCQKHKEIWLQLQHSTHKGYISNSIKVVTCVFDALSLIEIEEDNFDVLVTGSLLLVGAVLSVLDPMLKRTFNCPVD